MKKLFKNRLFRINIVPKKRSWVRAWNSRASHNIMNVFFFGVFAPKLWSRKWHMIGFFISSLSKSESFSRENRAPSSPFLCTWLTILSSIPICRKNVDMSSAEKSCRFPSFGISISCSGMNFCLAEKEQEYIFTDVRCVLYTFDLKKPRTRLLIQVPTDFDAGAELRCESCGAMALWYILCLKGTSWAGFNSSCQVIQRKIPLLSRPP